MKIVAPMIGLVVGLALEVVILVGYLRAQPDVGTSFYLSLAGVHLAVSFLISLALYRLSIHWGHSSPKNWFITSMLLCAIFPFVGAFLVAGAFFSYVAAPAEKFGAYEEYEKYISYDFKPEEKYMPSDRLLEGIGEELEVLPLVEVLGEANAGVRRGVINVLGRLPKKDAVKLLKIVLDDQSVEVRYSAAFELSQIEAEFSENISMARQELQRNPNSPDAQLELANAYSEYYESGLLDEYAAKYYRDLAIQAYEKTLELGGENMHVLNYLGHLQLQAKNYGEALAKFGRVTEIDSGNVFANVGLINVHFDRGRIREAIRYAKEAMVRMPETKGPMREIVSYWAG